MAISQREIELPRYFDADETRFLFTDALGSVTSVKSVKGGDEKIRYDAWGGFLEKYERTGHIEEYSKRGVLLGYNGQPYDNFTGLYNYGYRHLDIDSKQWLTQDPIRDGSNWHSYLAGVGICQQSCTLFFIFFKLHHSISYSSILWLLNCLDSKQLYVLKAVA